MVTQPLQRAQQVPVVQLSGAVRLVPARDLGHLNVTCGGNGPQRPPRQLVGQCHGVIRSVTAQKSSGTSRGLTQTRGPGLPAGFLTPRLPYGGQDS